MGTSRDSKAKGSAANKCGGAEVGRSLVAGCPVVLFQNSLDRQDFSQRSTVGGISLNIQANRIDGRWEDHRLDTERVFRWSGKERMIQRDPDGDDGSSSGL